MVLHLFWDQFNPKPVELLLSILSPKTSSIASSPWPVASVSTSPG